MSDLPPTPNLSNSEVAVRAYHGRPGYWRTLDIVDYETPEKEIITVPRGFVTDFASIPRVFWNVLPPFGRYTAAAVIHDYLYFKQDRERLHADLIFLWAMQELQVERWKRHSMYQAVRIFGQRPWKLKVTAEQQDFNLGM
jgi:hypothetical protein